MIIGFKQNDIKTGGALEQLYYDEVICTGRKVEDDRGFRAVEIREGEIDYDWLVLNKDVIAWENVAIYVELPVSFKTTPAPSWLTNYQYVDENGDTQTHTLESYGKIREDNLAGTRWILKTTVYKDLTLSQLNQLEVFLGANPTATGMLVKETRDLLNGVLYTAP